MKAEVQIRSILQHSWAEIEHDLGYKGANEIPDTAKRTFYRVAALLEQADIEFVKLKNEIDLHIIEVSKKLDSEPENLAINVSSLISFLENSKLVFDLEEKVKNNLGFQIEKYSNFIDSEYVNDLKTHNINNIKELEDSFIANTEKMYKVIDNYNNKLIDKGTSFKPISKGASLLWLRSVLNNED